MNFLIMAALWNRAGHYILYFHPVVSSIFLLLSFFPRLISAVRHWMSNILPYTWCGLSANIECISETCCTRHAENTGRKWRKNRHLGTIRQLCRAISLQRRHISTIGKKLVKEQYLLHMCLQYGELRYTGGWDRLVCLVHPCKFQPVSRLGSVTARHSIGRQPNFAALNRGRQLHSAGRPSRGALAHISSLKCYSLLSQLTAVAVFTPKSRTLPRHFNENICKKTYRFKTLC